MNTAQTALYNLLCDCDPDPSHFMLSVGGRNIVWVSEKKAHRGGCVVELSRGGTIDMDLNWDPSIYGIKGGGLVWMRIRINLGRYYEDTYSVVFVTSSHDGVQIAWDGRQRTKSCFRTHFQLATKLDPFVFT